MLYQLRYEATDVGSRSIVGSYVPVKEMSVNDIWNKSYMNCGNEMKMKKWSSQWTQFLQLRKEAWKKFRTSTGFELVTSRLLVRCSTSWAMKPLTLWAGQLWVQMFSWKKWVLMIYNGNWTEWSAIWSEIMRVISKSNERAARVQFEITSMISDQNCTPLSSITTLLLPFWNRRI